MPNVSVRFVRNVDPSSDAAREIRRLLELTDSEFVPPLHVRYGPGSIHSTVPGPPDFSAGIDAYLALTLDKPCLIAERGDRVAGFANVLLHRCDPHLPAWSPHTQVATIAVDPLERRSGVASALYEAVLKLPPDLASPHVVIRTWAGNGHHIGLLDKMGFCEAHRIDNDRGEGVHTIYFARSVDLARQQFGRDQSGRTSGVSAQTDGLQ